MGAAARSGVRLIFASTSEIYGKSSRGPLREGDDRVHIPFTEAYPHGFEELGRRRADTTSIRELTGWTPSRTIGDAVDDAAAHRRESVPTAAGP